MTPARSSFIVSAMLSRARNGGGSGIRTHVTLAGKPVFKSCAARDDRCHSVSFCVVAFARGVFYVSFCIVPCHCVMLHSRSKTRSTRVRIRCSFTHSKAHTINTKVGNGGSHSRAEFIQKN